MLVREQNSLHIGEAKTTRLPTSYTAKYAATALRVISYRIAGAVNGPFRKCQS